MAISILGEGRASKSSLVVMFVVPIYNILSVFILSARSSKNKKFKFSRVFLNVLKNPLIISILLGVLFSILSIKIPYMLDKPLQYPGNTLTPLALILIGGSFNFKNSRQKLKPAILAAILKTAVIPVIVICSAILLGFSNDDLVIIFVMIAVPASVSSYILSLIMDSDSDLASSIIILSTILTAFTNTLGIYLLKTFHII